jgi:hypothetical protein
VPTQHTCPLYMEDSKKCPMLWKLSDKARWGPSVLPFQVAHHTCAHSWSSSCVYSKAAMNRSNIHFQGSWVIQVPHGSRVFVKNSFSPTQWLLRLSEGSVIIKRIHLIWIHDGYGIHRPGPCSGLPVTCLNTPQALPVTTGHQCMNAKSKEKFPEPLGDPKGSQGSSWTFLNIPVKGC